MSAIPRAFVVMPFGKKKAPDGGDIDFDAIYADLLAPATRKPRLPAASVSARARLEDPEDWRHQRILAGARALAEPRQRGDAQTTPWRYSGACGGNAEQRSRIRRAPYGGRCIYQDETS